MTGRSFAWGRLAAALPSSPGWRPALCLIDRGGLRCRHQRRLLLAASRGLASVGGIRFAFAVLFRGFDLGGFLTPRPAGGRKKNGKENTRTPVTRKNTMAASFF